MVRVIGGRFEDRVVGGVVEIKLFLQQGRAVDAVAREGHHAALRRQKQAGPGYTYPSACDAIVRNISVWTGSYFKENRIISPGISRDMRECKCDKGMVERGI